MKELILMRRSTVLSFPPSLVFPVQIIGDRSGFCDDCQIRHRLDPMKSAKNNFFLMKQAVTFSTNFSHTIFRNDIE